MSGNNQTSLFEKRKIARVGYLRHFGKFESGLILSYDGNLRLNKSLTYRANERTVGYLQYDFAVSELIGLVSIPPSFKILDIINAVPMIGFSVTMLFMIFSDVENFKSILL